jgi:hypothetical protein
MSGPLTALVMLTVVGILEHLVCRAYDAAKLRWFTELQQIDPEELPPW